MRWRRRCVVGTVDARFSPAFRLGRPFTQKPTLALHLLARMHTCTCASMHTLANTMAHDITSHPCLLSSVHAPIPTATLAPTHSSANASHSSHSPTHSSAHASHSSHSPTHSSALASHSSHSPTHSSAHSSAHMFIHAPTHPRTRCQSLVHLSLGFGRRWPRRFWLCLAPKQTLIMPQSLKARVRRSRRRRGQLRQMLRWDHACLGPRNFVHP